MIINDKSVVPPWLSELEATLAAAVDRGLFAHAVLIHGAQGSGRKRLVTSLAARLLNMTGAGLADPGAVTEDELLRHPDFLSVQPEPDKQSISVEQIRVLIKFLHLTSHQSGAKLVSLDPADAMTANAANSLLKTLEEPPAGSIIFLVAEVLSRLPPTIISRCQRVRVPVAPHPGPRRMDGLLAGVVVEPGRLEVGFTEPARRSWRCTPSRRHSEALVRH